MAEQAGVDPDAVATLRRAELAPVALSEPAYEGGPPLEDLVSAEPELEPAAVVVTADGRASVQGALSSLATRERRVLELRYGLNGRTPRTLSEVARELGVSSTRIRAVEARALQRLAKRPEMEVLRAA